MKKQQHRSSWPLHQTNGGSFVLFYVLEALKKQWAGRGRGNWEIRYQWRLSWELVEQKWKVRCLCQHLFSPELFLSANEGTFWKLLKNHHKLTLNTKFRNLPQTLPQSCLFKKNGFFHESASDWYFWNLTPFKACQPVRGWYEKILGRKEEAGWPCVHVSGGRVPESCGRPPPPSWGGRPSGQ